MARDSWTFRIVDQASGAPVPGVPVTVLDDGGTPVSYWVSDAEGLVAIPRWDRPRLRLRVGLRSEEPIELDTKALGESPVPLAAPHRGQPVAPTHAVGVDPAFAPPTQSVPAGAVPTQILRYYRIAVLGGGASADSPAPADLSELEAPEDPAPIRYGVLFEIEQSWQQLGTETGDLLYSASLAPGDEVRAVVLDGRWRRAPQRERPLQIVGKMVGTPGLGDRSDAVQLEPLPLTDLAAAAAATVSGLAERTARMCASLRRRPLGVTELQGEPPEDAAIRTVRNSSTDAVVTYHFLEPLARYRVIVRAPHVRPAILVPFRLPNLATQEVIRQFGHVLKRGILDRALLADLDAVAASDQAPPSRATVARVCDHVAANLVYYSATIIAAGEPDQRHRALAKLRDPAGRILTDVIENTVVGRVGNYVAFALRSAEFAPPAYRAIIERDSARMQRLSEDLTVLLPIPGVWLRAEGAETGQEGEPGKVESEPDEERGWRRRLKKR
jgi:hypothetical protein